MTQLTESLKFTVVIPKEVLQIAEKFSRQQTNPQKIKQVYLNTCAVYVGDYFVRYLGFKTDLAASDSWNPVMQTLIDTADLEVKNLGKLEFRPVLPDSPVVFIPLEVWSDRIGYVAVQLEQSLEKATLLGFTEATDTEELPIAQLRSLENLIHLLNQAQPSEPVNLPVQLRQWLKNIFESDWPPVEALLGIERRNPAYATREEASVSRAKLIELEMHLKGRAATLLVGIIPISDAEQKMEIRVQLHPVAAEKYLPPNLKLALLSESGRVIHEVQSRSQDYCIQLYPFKYRAGRIFRLRVALDEISVMEEFFAV